MATYYSCRLIEHILCNTFTRRERGRCGGIRVSAWTAVLTAREWPERCAESPSLHRETLGACRVEGRPFTWRRPGGTTPSAPSTRCGLERRPWVLAENQGQSASPGQHRPWGRLGVGLWRAGGNFRPHVPAAWQFLNTGCPSARESGPEGLAQTSSLLLDISTEAAPEKSQVSRGCWVAANGNAAQCPARQRKPHPLHLICVDLPVSSRSFSSRHRRKGKWRKCDPVHFCWPLCPTRGMRTYSLRVPRTETPMPSSSSSSLPPVTPMSSHSGCRTGFRRRCHFLAYPLGPGISGPGDCGRPGSWLHQARGPRRRVEIKAGWGWEADSSVWAQQSCSVGCLGVARGGQGLRPRPVTYSVLMGTYHSPDLVPCKVCPFPPSAHMFSTNILIEHPPHTWLRGGRQGLKDKRSFPELTTECEWPVCRGECWLTDFWSKSLKL